MSEPTPNQVAVNLLDEQLIDVKLRRAIVVPNTRRPQA
jgi:hypothetical protein